MGLTQNKDIAQIQQELCALKLELKQELDRVQAILDNIEDSVFRPDILEEPDSSWDIVRKKRDHLLAISDWTMTPGATVDQRAWSSYRQVLRDLPQTYENYGLDKIVWPVSPSIAGPNTTPVE